MKQPDRGAHRVLIMGAGRAGTAFLNILCGEKLVEIVGVFDHDSMAPGLVLAREQGIDVYFNMGTALSACEPCIVFNLTGDRSLELVASEVLGPGCIIGASEAKLIWRVLSNLHAAKEDLSYQAMHDVLTGKYNRRFLIETTKRGLSEARRYNIPFSIALLDIDRFKLINDHYGHTAGDEVLKAVANHLESHIRTSDTLGRWGGEEFLLLLPHTRVEDATLAVEKLLAQLKSWPIDVGSGRSLSISFSAGVAEFQSEEADKAVDDMVDDLIVKADRRMYQAKSNGRGCVVGVEKVNAPQR